MNRKNISEAIGNISTRHIQEAAEFNASDNKVILFRKPFVRAMTAAVFALIIIAGGLVRFFLTDSIAVNAYIYGTDEKIAEAGAVISTGTISDDGEMTGHPLMFYLSGRNIERVRFSCKSQKLLFTDWTEKRDDFGLAQNFTVSYGENEEEYYYLTIDWKPEDIIRELTDNADSSIKTLPAGMREDVIVMEVAFENGRKAVKAISISLLDDGTFSAKINDYSISAADTFVKRTDAPTLREISQNKIAEESKAPENKLSESKTHPAAKRAAMKYYANTVFKVISMKEKSNKDGKVTFSVCVSVDGVIQEPDRKISLRRKDGKWKVVGEGY